MDKEIRQVTTKIELRTEGTESDPEEVIEGYEGKECKTVYNNFNSVDIIKRFNDQFTSTIYQQFVDDLYYCIWHLENYYFDKIWAFRFQNSPKYNQMASLSFLKNVYRGSCSFLIPHGNLSSFIQSSIFQPFRLILKNENKVISFNLSF